MAFANDSLDTLDTNEMLFDVGGERPNDAADTRIDDSLSSTAGTLPGPPPYLSPSSASTFRSCARRWKFRYIDRLADPAGEAALAGTFAHRVLELLLQAPPTERTTDRARTIAREVWPEIVDDPDFTALGLDTTEERRFRWLSWTAIEGLWRLEDPTSVTVEATEQQLDTVVGGVPFRGIVDRLDRVDPAPTEPGGVDSGSDLIVVDYKSGRAPSRRFADSRLEQVLLYAAAIEASTGERPRAARLLYLGQCIIETEVTNELLDAATTALTETWGQIQNGVQSQVFDATPGPLCGWCPYAGECPEGLVELEDRSASGRIRASAPSLKFLATVS